MARGRVIRPRHASGEPPEDLNALAADIKKNGLLHAIVIDDTGMLIDGRMRLAACEIADVEPTYERLNVMLRRH
jgi:ParB-like chromosome segregation protein Spo0J